jgi:hypothetical protein
VADIGEMAEFVTDFCDRSSLLFGDTMRDKGRRWCMRKPVGRFTLRAADISGIQPATIE